MAGQGGRIFSGRFGPGLLNFSGANNRIDIVLSAAIPTDPTIEPQFPSIGSWNSIKSSFYGFADGWIAKTKYPIIRIAFGAVLNFATPDRDAAYGVLEGMLTSVKIDSQRMREVSFRVNWQTHSKLIQDLIINRITNWSAIQLMQANIQLPAAQIHSPGPLLNGARLELDINTDISRAEPFPQTQLSPIFKELITYASEIAENGEPK